MLTGNSGVNRLEGLTGADTLQGGRGSDVYICDAPDVVVEDIASGIDRVETAVSCSLVDNVENLTLSGLSGINGTGNNLDNLIVGNTARNTSCGQEGNDILQGGDGNDLVQGGQNDDVLMGEAGLDTRQGGDGAGPADRWRGQCTFVFAATREMTDLDTTCDVITDFVPGQDRIDLSAIDANPLAAGNNAFTFRLVLGTQLGGDVSLVQIDNVGIANDPTLVQIDIIATAAPEVLIRLTGPYTLTAADYIL